VRGDRTIAHALAGGAASMRGVQEGRSQTAGLCREGKRMAHGRIGIAALRRTGMPSSVPTTEP
jgi:hypothetical protein